MISGHGNIETAVAAMRQGAYDFIEKPFKADRLVLVALRAPFGRAVGKDTVSRVWRQVKRDREAWNARSLVEEPIVRLILDGTVVRARLDREATSISLLIAGVRADALRRRAGGFRAPS